MKKIFLDCGTNTGEGLRHFDKMYDLSNDWQIYLFEPNPNLKTTIEETLVKNSKFKIKKFQDIAVCGKNYPESIDFYLQVIENGPVGGGSTLIDRSNIRDNELSTEIDGKKLDYIKTTVKTARLAALVLDILKENEISSENFDKLEHIFVLKLDVEGAEYDILQDLLETNFAAVFTDIHVEFHARRFKDPSSKIQLQENLIRDYTSRGINFFLHY